MQSSADALSLDAQHDTLTALLAGVDKEEPTTSVSKSDSCHQLLVPTCGECNGTDVLLTGGSGSRYKYVCQNDKCNNAFYELPSHHLASGMQSQYQPVGARIGKSGGYKCRACGQLKAGHVCPFKSTNNVKKKIKKVARQYTVYRTDEPLEVDDSLEKEIGNLIQQKDVDDLLRSDDSNISLSKEMIQFILAEPEDPSGSAVHAPNAELSNCRMCHNPLLVGEVANDFVCLHCSLL